MTGEPERLPFFMQGRHDTNIDGFITYMKENKKSERCVREYARCAQEFSEFLSTTAANKTIDNANPGDIEAFSKAGIRNAKQLLNAGLTRRNRKKLSRETGLSEKTVLEFVKLSDLARIGGLKESEGGYTTMRDLTPYK